MLYETLHEQQLM